MMTDGNSQAIAKHLDERDEWAALQEVTVELEQAESDNILLISRIEELEAKLDKAMKLIEYAIELGRWDLNPSLRDDLIDFSAELKGETDE